MLWWHVTCKERFFFFQFLFFFVISKDDLQFMMGRYGISFMHYFSIYLVSTSCGPDIKPHFVYGVGRRCVPVLTLQSEWGGGFAASCQGWGGQTVILNNFWLYSIYTRFLVYMYHRFLIHSPINGHLGWFHVLAVVNSNEHWGVCVFFNFAFFRVYA